MKKVTDTGVYKHGGKTVSISYRGRSDRYNTPRVIQNNRKYVDSGQGGGTEDLYAIMDRYNIKGFEFGNWVTQEERAEYVAAITPTLEDLASITHSHNIGIDKNVGIAFGARGQGKARAHYEAILNMINLTKEHGAGSLAHEYGHAIDYNFGSFVDRHANYAALSGGHSISSTLKENTGGQLRALVNQIVDSIRNGKNFAILDSTPGYGEYWYRRTEIFARFFEQYVCYKLYERNISSRLLTKTWQYYLKYPVYVERGDFMKLVPVADKLMSELGRFLNNSKGHRVRPTSYPNPVIAAKSRIKKAVVTNPASTRKAAELKSKIKSYEKKYGKLVPKSGRGKRITKRTNSLFGGK